MIVEFVGLPASGKSTLMNALLAEFNQLGYDATTITTLARAEMATAARKRQFVRHRVERTSLFGSVWYGFKNPVVHRCLSEVVVDHPKEIYGNLEYLAELYFAEPAIPKAGLVFSDEGLIHRGVLAFNGRPDHPDLERYFSEIPRNIVCIHVNVPVRVAARRSIRRNGKMPYLRSFRSRDPLQVMRDTWWLNKRAAELCTARGMTVVEVDGRMPTSDLVVELREALMDVIIETPTTQVAG